MITPIPSNISETQDVQGKTLIREWKKGFMTLLPLTLFTLIWNGLLVVWYLIVLKADKISLMMVLVPLLHVSIGIGLIYYLLCSYLNKTYFTVSHFDLTIRHRPMPFLGNKRIPVAQITQIFCMEKKMCNRNQREHISYVLCYLDPQGVKQSLFWGIEEGTEALYLERRLEALLGIKDKPVTDSYRG